MLDPQEELEPIDSDAKAPTYGSTNLSSNKESLKVPEGIIPRQNMFLHKYP